MKTLFVSLAVLALAATSFAFDYSNNFESPVGAEWSTSAVQSFNGTTVLGQFGNNTVTLTLTGLNAGYAVTAGFDLYIRDSWDGNQTGVGPDRFTFTLDGNTDLDTTFSNVSGYNQSFPDSYLAGSYAAQTGADNKDLAHGGTLPNGYYGNSLYIFGGANHAAFTEVASSSTLVLTWAGSNLQGVGDEGWDIDNVWVHQDAVPEPATLSILGFGVLLAARRRKG